MVIHLFIYSFIFRDATLFNTVLILVINTHFILNINILLINILLIVSLLCILIVIYCEVSILIVDMALYEIKYIITEVQYEVGLLSDPLTINTQLNI